MSRNGNKKLPSVISTEETNSGPLPPKVVEDTIKEGTYSTEKKDHIYEEETLDIENEEPIEKSGEGSIDKRELNEISKEDTRGSPYILETTKEDKLQRHDLEDVQVGKPLATSKKEIRLQDQTNFLPTKQVIIVFFGMSLTTMLGGSSCLIYQLSQCLH
jgi:hypothetical protein